MVIEKDPETTIRIDIGRDGPIEVTFRESQLYSGWIENEIRHRLESYGLPKPIADDLTGRIVERLRAAVERRRAVESALDAIGGGRRLGGGALRDPLAFVANRDWWGNNDGGIRGFFAYVQGYYETVWSVGVELIIVDGSTDFESLGNANAGEYAAVVVLAGHGSIVDGNYVLQGGINGWVMLSFIDKIMVSGDGRRGVSAGSCFAGHMWVRPVAEKRLRTQVKGGDLVNPVYSTTDVVPELEAVSEGIGLRVIPSGAGLRILENLSTFYGTGGGLPCYVDFYAATKTYVVGP